MIISVSSLRVVEAAHYTLRIEACRQYIFPGIKRDTYPVVTLRDTYYGTILPFCMHLARGPDLAA